MNLKELLEAKLRSRSVRDDSIILYTEIGSACELSRENSLAEFLKKDFNIKIEPPIFFFNRLKARTEGKGEGTLLMNELVKILDEKNITVVNQLNPYGKMTMENLEKFYSKYGFKKKVKGLMIREPK